MAKPIPLVRDLTILLPRALASGKEAQFARRVLSRQGWVFRREPTHSGAMVWAGSWYPPELSAELAAKRPSAIIIPFPKRPGRQSPR
ncbi:hypothetical protein [Siccirubricoccus phaeus]|uniref:hypothetical protein n=1 Tax=Siccirubricoccus phaeus TaxID=2595053 RepID=UPI0011F0FB78|nr:hypothetical protein [Siccirubricoccus phaeus]